MTSQYEYGYGRRRCAGSLFVVLFSLVLGAIMLGRRAMLAADAAISFQLAFGIEGIIEGRHHLRPFVAPAP